MFIVGLTGGIGSGKTTVSDLFAEKGITVVDADIAARTVVAPNTPALKEISDYFGNDILQSDGTLNRARLRQIVFSNPEKKHWLESLLHPLIGQQINKELESATSPFVLFVSPLLVESGQDAICQRVLVVDIPEHLQLDRVSLRDNNTHDEVKAIINTQTSRDIRNAKADHIIVNDSDLAALEKKVDQLYQLYLKAAKEYKA